MSKIYKLVMATFVAAIFTAGSAMAFNGGISIGVIGNWAQFKTSGSETETNMGATETGSQEVNKGSKDESGQFPGLFLEFSGAGHRGEDGGFAMTVGFEYTPGSASIGAQTRTDAETPAVGDSGDDDGTYTGKAEVEHLMMMYIEPTYMVGGFGAYLKAGVAHVTINSLESIEIGNDSSSYDNVDVFGSVIGIGIKGIHSSGLFFKLEGTETDYEHVVLTSTSATSGSRKQINADPEATAVRLAIGYNF